MGRTDPDLSADNLARWVADLGLEWPITRADVDAAYRRLARVYHPDHGGGPADFVRIQQARNGLRMLFREQR